MRWVFWVGDVRYPVFYLVHLIWVGTNDGDCARDGKDLSLARPRLVSP